MITHTVSFHFSCIQQVENIRKLSSVYQHIIPNMVLLKILFSWRHLLHTENTTPYNTIIQNVIIDRVRRGRRRISTARTDSELVVCLFNRGVEEEEIQENVNLIILTPERRDFKVFDFSELKNSLFALMILFSSCN